MIGELEKGGYIKTETDTKNNRRIFVDLFCYNGIANPEEQNTPSVKTEYNNTSQLDKDNRISVYGTAEPSTLKYYTHTNFKAKRNAADKINSMLAI